MTREHVIWAYRLLLDREPESEVVVQEKLRGRRTTRELRTEFLTSREFLLANPDLGYEHRHSIVMKELDGGLRLFLDLADYHIGLNIARGRYELAEVAFVRRTVGPGDVVLDIGANIGYFTMLVAAQVGPTGHVYAFEPVAANADLLERSVAENRFEDRVTLERVALGAAAGTMRLVFDPDAVHSGLAYLDTSGAGATSEPSGVDVRVVALDDYLDAATVLLRRPVRFVKIDAEGAELLVVRGASRLLREDRPVILSELNREQLEQVSGCLPEHLIATLEELGYEPQLLADDGRTQGRPLRRSISDVNSFQIRSVVFWPRRTRP